MSKSYVVKTTLCIEDCQFYLRAGDILVYEPSTLRLTVYRGGAIAKTLKQTGLSIAGLVKSKIIEEQVNRAPAAAPKKAATPKQEAQEFKRQKIHPKEVRIDDTPRLKETLTLKDSETTTKETTI